MNPLIRAYDLHKKEFGLEENILLRHFETLLATPPCSILECSAQISPGSTHGAKIRLGYEQRAILAGLQASYDLLNKIAGCDNVRLNRDMLSELINNNLDITKVVALGLGLDCKSNIHDSKVKYYLMVREYPEKVKQVIALHPLIEGIRDYPVHEEFVFGIGMYFDGRTGVEIYPCLDRQDLDSPTLMAKLKLRDAVQDLIKECNLLHISFQGNGGRVFYFHPRAPARFVRLLNNRRLSLAYSSVQTINYILRRSYKTAFVSVNLSVIEDEISSKDIKNIGLQYALTYRA